MGRHLPAAPAPTRGGTGTEPDPESAPDPRLPEFAAARAARCGERLVYGERLLALDDAATHPTPDLLMDLLAARTQASPHALSIQVDPTMLTSLIQEVRALRATASDYRALLVEAAHREAQAHDHLLRRPLVCLRTPEGDEVFLPWVDGADAPAATALTTEQATTRGFPAAVLQAAREKAVERARHGRDLYNRAGPGEANLTEAAMLRAYADEQAYRDFRLTPADIVPTRDVAWNEQTQAWDDLEWEPWAPDAVPNDLPAGTPDRWSTGG